MTIAFFHPHQAFLPELNFYRSFFSGYGIETAVFRSEEAVCVNADVKWYFMGMDTGEKPGNTVTVHEYASASLPPFGQWKDRLKRRFNTKPGFRLFLNEYVQQQFGFKDGIPFGYRDMGIHASLLQKEKNPRNKLFDFIYTGSLDKARQIEKLIRCFTKRDMQAHSLLVIGTAYDALAEEFKAFSNIHFMGPLPHEAVPGHLETARFAINYMPDIAPFNQQTSTKILEYAALQIPVISSRYEWVQKFQLRQGGSFFYLEENLSNFTWKNISQYAYSFPDLQDWTWEKQVRKSGILEFLESRFPQLSFGPS
jgi:glycosyltransferase involved in cell wall biosynthesis